MGSKGISILFPDGNAKFTRMTDSAFHDLGLDSICKELTSDAKERKYITGVISNMTADADTARFRQEVFADILDLSQLRKKITELFERLEFMKSFGSLAKKTEEKLGIWYLLHRLDNAYEPVKRFRRRRG